MMGPTHAMSGAALWLVAAPLISSVAPQPFSTAEVLVGAALCAGAAVVPDIDEPSSTIARSFGPVSWLAAKGVWWLSVAWYNLTRGPGDPPSADGHRKLTHTLFGQILLTGLAAALAGWGGRTGALILMFILTGLAMRGLMHTWVKRNGWIVTTTAAAAATWAAAEWLPGGGSYWWLTATVFAGVVIHGLGDTPTKDGMPWLAPFIPIRGKRWFDVALPSLLRFKANGWLDKAFLAIFTVVALAGVTAKLLGGWGVLLTAILGTS